MRTFRLGKGAHAGGADGGVGCVNEIASQLAGLSWGDSPPCVDPVIQKLSIWYNDTAASDEALNADPWATLLPWRLVGTKSTPEIEQRRAYMAADWAVRFVCPVLLRRAGLNSEAVKLESLPEIDCAAARADADAARAAAYAAYAADAADAADAAAYAAAYAAYAAADAAAYAAYAAAYAADTLEKIRDSLRGVIDRMIALTEPVEAACEVKLIGCGA